MIAGRYTAKMVRDAGVGATLIGLGATGAIDNIAIRVIAFIGAAGSILCAFRRAPLVMAEMQSNARAVTSMIKGRKATWE